MAYKGRHSIGATGREAAVGAPPVATPARGGPARLLWRATRSSAAPALVAVLPVLAIAVHAMQQIHRSPLYGGDYALLEMGARSALHGAQRLGPYSRFGWDHPGPATFYWSAPFYALSGQRPEGLALSALASNMAAIVAIVLVARRAGGAAVGWAAAVAVLFVLQIGGATWLDHPWNPLTVILPVAALAVLGAGAAAGLRWSLPFAVLAASYAVQTHIGTAPTVGALVMTLTPFVAWRWHRAHVAWRRPVVAAGLVLVALWVLPIIQQLRDGPGNFKAIADFFRQNGGVHHSLSEATRITGPELTLSGKRLFSSLARQSSTPLTSGTVTAMAVLGGAVLLGLLWNVHRRRWFCAGLCAAGLSGAIGSVLGAQRVLGMLIGYLTSSALSIGLVLAVALCATVAAEAAAQTRRLPHAPRVALAVLVTVGLLGGSAAVAKRNSHTKLFATPRARADLARLVSTVQTQVRRRPGQPVYIDPQVGTNTWSLAALVANALERDGVTIRTPAAWEYVFGAQRTARPGEATHIRFIDVRDPPPRTPRGRVLGRVGFTQASVVAHGDACAADAACSINQRATDR